jgi:peptidoglycan/LPS O-acetylase OafA/YrhL
MNLLAVNRSGIGAHRRDIQGLRALAVLLVIAFHAGLPIRGGFVGVDVFFAISGFVITGILVRERENTGTVRLGAFYLRRFRRLMPALAVTIVFTFLATSVVFSPLRTQRTVTDTGAGAMLFSANWVISNSVGGYFDAPAASNPLLHTWSLSVEEQFYLVFPCVLAFCFWTKRRRAQRRGHQIPGLAATTAITVLSFGLACAGPTSHLGKTLTARSGGILGWFSLGFYSPLTRAWEFGFGALLALVVQTGAPRVRWFSGFFPRVFGLFAIVGSAAALSSRLQAPGPWTVLPLIGTLVLLVPNESSTDGVTRLLSSRPLVAIGDLSYSLYLWHWPVIVIAKTAFPRNPTAIPCAVAISALLAVATFRWAERPIRSINSSKPRTILPFAAITFLIPIVAATLLGSANSSGFWSDRVRVFRESALAKHAALIRGCDGAFALSAQVVARCTWNVRSSGPTVYVVGDSNADHFSEGIIAGALTVGSPVVISTTNACPFFDLQVVRTDHAPMSAGCKGYVDDTLSFFDSAVPAIVIISQAPVYAHQASIELSDDRSDLTRDRARKLELIRSSLLRTVLRLERAGHRVVLVQAAPWWDTWSPDRCSLLTVVANRCAAAMALNAAKNQYRGYRAAVSAVASRTHAKVFDPLTVLCTNGTCSATGPGFLRYRDAAHISVRQSSELESSWAIVLAEVI